MYDFKVWAEQTSEMISAKNNLEKTVNDQFQEFADYLKEIFSDSGDIRQVTVTKDFNRVIVKFRDGVDLDVEKLSLIPFPIRIEEGWNDLAFIIFPFGEVE